ncbi:DNA polymerase II large subunit [Halobaculum sp. MBLA0147]|uniref:DNA polymerase II large subunit n=1 Tax=Halobaculum sp. MBLA0147 TaxID=3079934 RepID=UPI003524B146
MRPDDERYFERIEDELDEAFARATAAKERGRDPETEIEIPVARDMADRVENILGIDGVAERVRELEGEMSREEAALELVTDFVEGTVGDFDSRAGKVEGAVRTAVALLTEGVVAAPIEGIDRVEILENDDGTEFVNVYYAGPIRSAGGTAQALSVLVADYARSLLDVEEFRPRDDEVERYAEEIDLYDSETGLQYTPKAKETKFITEHTPIMLDGEATSDGEVDGFRDLERIDTNAARGGMCLVLAEGIALKAPKIQRYTRQLDEVEWPWLQDLIDGTYDDHADEDDGGEEDADGEDGDDTTDEADETDAEGTESGDTDAEGSGDGDDGDESDGGAADTPPRAEPSEKFLRDLIAGRPVFGHPSESGGFRLRYGRARNHGFATAGVHPATMHLVDDFLATGTQIKTERPGKAAGVVPVDSIEGPTVRLANGDVRRIDDPQEALDVRNGVEEILDLGEYLVNYGEFVENNHPLAPASYTVEWWVQEFADAGADVQALRDDPTVSVDEPTPDEALSWATDYDAPLHPAYTYLWHDVSVADVDALAAAVADGEVTGDVLVFERTETTRRVLERLLVEHTQTPDALRVPGFRPLLRQLGVSDGLAREWTLADLSESAREYDGGDNAIRAVNEIAPFRVRERAPTRIGNRMGRPEKSESRELSPAVHTLFPIGEAGGSQRSVGEAARTRTDAGRGVIEARVGERACPDCGTHTYRVACPDCGAHTEPYYECRECGTVHEPDESGRVVCDRCDREVESPDQFTIDLNERLAAALDEIGEREGSYEILKGVKGLSSADKTPEPLAKGVLRAKHGVSAFKDGTVRYDMTDLPVTAVRPEELDVTADHFRQLGYETDVDGEPLRHDDQLVELKVQDVVLSEGAAQHMMRTADFVDDLLERFYDLEPFYEVNERDDLVGELVFGMAPHTSAAVVGRVVGFTSAAVGYAHPYFHAAKRRNCDGDEDCVMLLMDGLLNFSKTYLPDQRGGSVAEDSRLVAVGPDGDVEFTTFDEFWDRLNSPVERDGKFRKKTCRSEGWRTYAFDDSHRASLRPIEKAIRYEAADDTSLVRIETQFGRSLEVTEHHSLFRYDGEIEEVAGEELSEGDLILAPESLDIGTESKTLDLLDRLGDPYVFIDDDVEEYLEHVWNDAEWGSDTREAFDGGLAYRLSKRKVHADTLDDITDESGTTLPEDLTVGIKGSSDGIDRHVEVDEEFAWLLGLFAAEGSTSSVQPTINNADEEVIERARAITERTLGHDPNVSWSNDAYRLGLPTVFRELLYSLGFVDADSYDSSEKVVPQCIRTAPDRVALAFLRGFKTGDGSETSDDNHTTVAFHTTSEQLKDGIVFLLHRLGIVANISYRERDDPRQPIYNINVSGGRDDNPLRRILDGEEPYRPKSLTVTIPDALREIRESGLDGVKQAIPKYLKRRENVSLEKLDEMVADVETLVAQRANEETANRVRKLLDEIRPLVDGDLAYLRVENVERSDYEGYLYDLQVGGDPVFTANWLYAHNSMDAPLVMSSRIDPTEIDDEAHNMDVVDRYPREFYEATREQADPEAVDVQIAEETLGTDDQYHGFDHTHDTTDIHMGPALSAYKTLGSMMDKMDAQLNLSRTLRAVDETDVAERVIEYHFLPDLIGNLRAFSSQETRCLDCGEKYRRMPLTGDCRECGGDMTLTVHRGSVNKYMDTAREVAEEFGCREYTKQRLEILDRSLESIFENDHNKPTSIEDFM